MLSTRSIELFNRATRLLCAVAALVVFATHRRVLESAGYGAALFLHDCRSQYAFYLKWPPALRRLSAHGT